MQYRDIVRCFAPSVKHRLFRAPQLQSRMPEETLVRGAQAGKRVKVPVVKSTDAYLGLQTGISGLVKARRDQKRDSEETEHDASLMREKRRVDCNLAPDSTFLSLFPSRLPCVSLNECRMSYETPKLWYIRNEMSD